MKIDLFVHGVPYGESYWRKGDDQDYFGTFYDRNSDEVKCLIQVRMSEGKAYCYFNYLVNRDVLDSQGRAGSYFGMTLRIDSYCKDIVNVYRILDTLFNIYVMGTLLKKENGKLKYVVSDFSAASSILEGIENSAIQLFQKAFTNESFLSLKGFATNGGNLSSVNLYDCTPDHIFNIVKQYGRVVISPYAQSLNEIAKKKYYDSQVESIKKQYDSQLIEEREATRQQTQKLEGTIQSLNNQVSELQKGNSEKGKTITQLQIDIARLESEKQKIGQSKKAAKIVEQISGPIEELSKVMRRLVPDDDNFESQFHGNNNYSTNHQGVNQSKSSILKTIKSLIPFVNFILLVVIALTLLNPFKVDSCTEELTEDKIEFAGTTMEGQEQNNEAKSVSMNNDSVQNTTPASLSKENKDSAEIKDNIK